MKKKIFASTKDSRAKTSLSKKPQQPNTSLVCLRHPQTVSLYYHSSVWLDT